METTKNSNFIVLSDSEMMNVDGGASWWWRPNLLGLVIARAVAQSIYDLFKTP